MANINHLITLGIGTPADIPHFVLFGLSPSGPVVAAELRAADATLYLVPRRDTVDDHDARATFSRLRRRATTEL